MAEALLNARQLQIARAGHAPLLSHVDEVKLAIAGFLGALPRDRRGVPA
jgi:hypothetical protein